MKTVKLALVLSAFVIAFFISSILIACFGQDDGPIRGQEVLAIGLGFTGIMLALYTWVVFKQLALPYLRNLFFNNIY
jgi:hypothetical protein